MGKSKEHKETLKERRFPRDSNREGAASPGEAEEEEPEAETLTALAGLLELGQGYAALIFRRAQQGGWEYVTSYHPPFPPDYMEEWKRDLGPGDYKVRVQYNGKWTDFPSVHLRIGRTLRDAAASEGPGPTAAEPDLKRLLGTAEDRVKLNAAIKILQAEGGAAEQKDSVKGTLELIQALKGAMGDDLQRLKAFADLLGLNRREEPAPASAKSPAEQVQETVKLIAAVREIAGGGEGGSGRPAWVDALIAFAPEVGAELRTLLRGITTRLYAGLPSSAGPRPPSPGRIEGGRAAPAVEGEQGGQPVPPEVQAMLDQREQAIGPIIEALRQEPPDYAGIIEYVYEVLGEERIEPVLRMPDALALARLQQIHPAFGEPELRERVIALLTTARQQGEQPGEGEEGT